MFERSMQQAPISFRKHLVELLPALSRFAWSLCRGERSADDLVQATCERALTRWAQFAPDTKMESWLFSIMHSIWKNELRHAGVQERARVNLQAEPASIDGERIGVGKIYFSQVLSKLNALPREQAAALTLVCLEGQSYRQASEILNIPQGTLESRIARGRIALGRALEAENPVAGKDGELSKSGGQS